MTVHHATSRARGHTSALPALAVLAALSLGLAALPFSTATAQPPTLYVGVDRIEVPRAAPDGSAITVWTYRTKKLAPDAPVVIVMHGVKRNAEDYRDDWIEAAEKYGFLIAAPEMSKSQFPHARGYNLGNMFDRDKRPLPRAEWAWNTIEKVFDHIKAASGSTAKGYTIFGHSAGAQFVHRFALFAGRTRATRIIAANAGWYTMPDFSVRFPYGLKASPAAEADLKAALGKPVTLMLGERDTNPNHHALRHNRHADRQGLNRFERGQAFFRQAKAAARQFGVPFGWRLVTVPGVGHNGRGMSKAAARLIAGNR